MISSEKLYDMLPTVVVLYDKLDLDAYRKKMTDENKEKKLDTKSLGIEVFKHVLKSSGKVKEEIFEIVAIFQDAPIEEVKLQSIGKTIKSIKMVFTDEDAVSFFKQAIE